MRTLSSREIIIALAKAHDIVVMPKRTNFCDALRYCWLKSEKSVTTDLGTISLVDDKNSCVEDNCLFGFIIVSIAKDGETSYFKITRDNDCWREDSYAYHVDEVKPVEKIVWEFI